MTHYDPHTTPDEQKTSGTSPLVWVLLGGGALLFCCVAVVVLGFASYLLVTEQDALAEELNVVAETVEAVRPVPTVTPTAVSITSQSSESESTTTSGRTLVYEETFEQGDGWGTGSIASDEDPNLLESDVFVADGVLDFTVYAESALFWSTADVDFGDGIYEVRTTAVDGPLDNGFGMLFMFDNEREDFYLFEISSDGYIWVGIYEGESASYTSFFDDGWAYSDVINQGLGASNVIRVEVNNGQMLFYVNDQLVTEATDSRLTRGNIGLFVETFSEGGARIQFDEFRYWSE